MGGVLRCEVRSFSQEFYTVTNLTFSFKFNILFFHSLITKFARIEFENLSLYLRVHLYRSKTFNYSSYCLTNFSRCFCKLFVTDYFFYFENVNVRLVQYNRNPLENKMTNSSALSVLPEFGYHSG